ncbi:MAG: DUF177 domain-containing protein [Pseudomonadales bacterium]|nr:DUF177 domain-containing protein [Pseudomonadales bacterium]
MEVLSPKKLCRKQALVQGSLPFSDFSRYKRIGHSDQSVDFYLNFAFDDQSLAAVRGRVKSHINLVCQRCLREVTRELEVQVDLIVLESEEQASELNHLDSIVVASDSISVVDLIEDDLILGVPEQVCPAFKDCYYKPQSQHPDQTLEVKQANPFDVLAKLKTAGKD